MGYIYLILIRAIYFLPAIYAYHSKNKNAEAILILNLFTGWSGIGWVVALCWSCCKDTNK